MTRSGVSQLYRYQHLFVGFYDLASNRRSCGLQPEVGGHIPRRLVGAGALLPGAPEPATFAVLGMGLLGLYLARSRRRA